jgi:hypothetical protein
MGDWVMGDINMMVDAHGGGWRLSRISDIMCASHHQKAEEESSAFFTYQGTGTGRLLVQVQYIIKIP